MKTITQNQYKEIQARWIKFMNWKHGLSFEALAQQFGVDLCNKLRTKYIIK